MKTYISASFDNPVPRWLRKDKRALEALIRSTGIDLKSAVFHHEPIGRGKSYPVYAIKNESNEDLTVWIPEIYNDDYRVPDPYSSNYTSIKYVPKKHLDIVDVVYVSKDSALKPAREHYQDPRYDSSGRYRGQVYNENAGKWSNYYSYSSDKYDKSGYHIPKPSEMLVKWYRQGGSNRLKDKLDKIYQTLKELQARIGSMKLDAMDPDEYNGDLFSNWMRGFADAVQSYRRFLRRYKGVLESGQTDSWRSSSMIQDLRQLERNINYLQNNAEDL